MTHIKTTQGQKRFIMAKLRRFNARKTRKVYLMTEKLSGYKKRARKKKYGARRKRRWR